MTDTRGAMDVAIQRAISAGLIIDSLELDGQWHRVPVEGKKASNRSGAYCLSEFVLRDGKVAVVGMISNWSQGIEERLTLDGIEGASPEDIAEAKKRARAAAEASKREKAQLQQETAKRSEEIWGNLPDQGKSDYLKNKHVKAWGLRFSRGSVVVPARDVAGALWTLQFINAEGGKKFLTGGAKRGHFHLIGEIEKNKPLGIVEGYATAATIHESTGIPVAVAFDAGNLLPVAMALRTKHSCNLIIFADHDRFNGYPQAFIKRSEASPKVMEVVRRISLVRPEVEIEVVDDNDPRLKERGKSHNVGVARAIVAAAAVDGDVLIPRFENQNEAVHEQ